MDADNSFVIAVPGPKGAMLKLHGAEWNGAAKRTDAPVLLFLHGFAEHGGRYRPIFERWKDHFAKGVSYDARGHGLSEGKRGHVERFDDFVDDLGRVLERVASTAAGRPLLILGHSMGGLVLARFLSQTDAAALGHFNIRGAAFSSPFLGLKLKPPVLKLALAKLLKNIYPALQLSGEIDASELSHDPQAAAAYESDPLIHNKITPNLFFELEKAARQTREAQGKIACPALFLVAGGDLLADPLATRRFYENLTADKEWVEFPGMYHEILNETRNEEVDHAFLKWVGKIK